MCGRVLFFMACIFYDKFLNLPYHFDGFPHNVSTNRGGGEERNGERC